MAVAPACRSSLARGCYQPEAIQLSNSKYCHPSPKERTQDVACGLATAEGSSIKPTKWHKPFAPGDAASPILSVTSGRLPVKTLMSFGCQSGSTLLVGSEPAALR
jgi:hypothetical protein